MSANKYSNLKIMHFPDKVKSFQEGKVTAPIYVRIKPINLCGDKCFWCVYHAPEKSQMHEEMNNRDIIPLGKLDSILCDLKQIGVKAITYSGGGEPLLHKDIVYMMDMTLILGLDLSIITNGQMLTGDRAAVLAHAKWVRVSMDYSTPEELHRFRNVAPELFEERMRNLEKFAAIKDAGCDLFVNYIVHRENCSNLVAVATRLKAAGVQNVRFSPMWIAPDFRAYHTTILAQVQQQIAHIAATLVDDGFSVNSTYDLDSPTKSSVRPFRRCLYMQTVPVIGADLGVYACHNGAYSKRHLIGSIRDRSFSDLWFSDEAKAVFEQFDPSRECNNMECANHLKVALYNEMADTSSDNFV